LTLNIAGATVSVGPGSTLGVVASATLTAGAVQLNGGTLQGGTWNQGALGTGVIRPANNTGNILNNVTLGSVGVLDLTSPSGRLRDRTGPCEQQQRHRQRPRTPHQCRYNQGDGRQLLPGLHHQQWFSQLRHQHWYDQ